MSPASGALSSHRLSTLDGAIVRVPRSTRDDLPRIGDVVLDRYIIESVLGEGGMGVVFRARHLKLEQTVALKVLRPEHAEREAAVQRFLREAKVAASLHGPHAVRVHDVGILPGKLPYMLMELLEGVDLEEHLATHGPLPVQEACSLIRDAALALTEAHALGCVHRDLKPSNLFLEQRGERTVLKVLDFGITKVGDLEDRARTLTEPGVLLGSPPYMSPEQVRNPRRVDARSDVWSLGVILYELLTSVSPFEGESVPHGFAMIANFEPPPPSEHLRRIPPQLDDVVLHCLRKRPDDRIGSARELAERLAPFVDPTASPPRPAPARTASGRRAPKVLPWLSMVGVAAASAFGALHVARLIAHDAAPPQAMAAAMHAPLRSVPPAPMSAPSAIVAVVASPPLEPSAAPSAAAPTAAAPSAAAPRAPTSAEAAAATVTTTVLPLRPARPSEPARRTTKPSTPPREEANDSIHLLE